MKTNVYWNIRKKVYSLRQNGRVVNHDTFVDKYTGEPVLNARFAQLMVVKGKSPLIAYWS